MTAPLISVIVVNFNGCHHLKTCLTSLQKQSLRDFETILVDNGSGDGSFEYVQREFPWVKGLSLDKNLGFAGGNNRGILKARGEYIALLNNDAEADEHWLEELYGEMKHNPSVGMCASKMFTFHNRTKLDSVGDYYTVAGDAGKIGEGQKDGHKAHSKRYVFGACAGAALYRRDLFEEIGLFDEDFFCYLEDIDLSFRAQLAGYKCLYVPSAVVYHKASATEKPGSPFLTYYIHRNSELVYYKNMPAFLILKYFHTYLAIRMLAAFYWILKGRGILYFKGKLSFLALLGQTMKKRKEIQKRRSVSVSYIESILDKQWLSAQLRRKGLLGMGGKN
jgi:GT2 family glycosyltransferase